MRLVLALLLVALGVAHLVGVVSSWKLATFAVATETGWAVRFTLAAVITSFILCLVGWPDDALAWLPIWDSHCCSRLVPV